MQHNVLAMSGRAVEAAGDVNTLLLDKTGTITLGNRQATEFHSGARRHRGSSWPMRRSSRRWPDETPEGRSIVVLAKEKYGLRGRELALASRRKFVPFTAQTRMSGVDLRWLRDPQGRRRCDRELYLTRQWHRLPDERSDNGRSRLPRCRRNAAGGRRENAGAWRDPPERHRQRRHEGTLRPAARHGHPHRHDHRRQSADRRGDRARSGRRRFPGRRPRRKTRWT